MEDDVVSVDLSIAEILEYKQKQLLRKAIKERHFNYHILLDGEHYKSFASNDKRRNHIQTKKFFKLAWNKEVRLIYDKQLYWTTQ